MPDLGILAQYRGADRIDMRHTSPAGTTPQGEGCGKTVEKMRRETEAFLTHIFKRDKNLCSPLTARVSRYYPMTSRKPSTATHAASMCACATPTLKGTNVTSSKHGRKAALCWVALIMLSVLNPTPTGGALLLIAPLAVYTYYTTQDWRRRHAGN